MKSALAIWSGIINSAQTHYSKTYPMSDQAQVRTLPRIPRTALPLHAHSFIIHHLTHGVLGHRCLRIILL